MGTTTGKSAEGTATGRRQDLEIAHEVHTLAQLIYAHLAGLHPWLPPMSGVPGGQMATGTAWNADWPQVWGQQPGWVR